MGDLDLRAMQLDPARTYRGEAPYGAMFPDERIELLDAEGIDAVVLYTTIGLLWEAELDDPELSQAYSRVQPLDLRISVQQEPAPGPDHAPVTERPVPRRPTSWTLLLATAHAARTCAPFTHDGRPLGHPDNDPVFAAAQELEVPFAIHPTFEPQWTKGTRMGPWEHVKESAAPRFGHSL